MRTSKHISIFIQERINTLIAARGIVIEGGKVRYKIVLMLIGVLSFLSCYRPSTATRFLEYQTAGDKAYTRQDAAEAEKQYKTAIAVAEEDGPENSLVLIGLRSLAQLYMSQKKDAEAESLFQKRVVIAERISSSNLEELAAVYDDLATFYLLRDRYSEAEPIYKRSLSIYQTAYGAGSPKVVENFGYYASLLRRINRNDEAAELEARAKSITKEGK